MLKQEEQTRLSKLMTKMLRHTPELFGLKLEAADGSCPVEELLAGLHRQRRWAAVTLNDVEEVVRTCPKQRFALEDGRIRARYGHSSERVAYTPGTPPAVLYHGTNTGAVAIIEREGLKPMGRQYVHLSEGLDFAVLAGERRGELVIVAVDTARAAAGGAVFYPAGHEVWLSDGVPADSLRRVVHD
ncbi:RNA 2'-phosphotransferase [Paenibacillus athensensis]|uniref:Probable RNA 2'-phosphotransferase n=1 Tax=Paenibacillus athensensis TaxID=1967502 RepID=A0A4Y8PZ49_9BACL|nr:RNA 2'-phosphotransferase [Paenibacillus athensensis]MCD1261482.1 RNA 2'-phosphotransferase [Paenibacillus athensensis]